MELEDSPMINLSGGFHHATTASGYATPVKTVSLVVAARSWTHSTQRKEWQVVHRVLRLRHMVTLPVRLFVARPARPHVPWARPHH